MFVSVILVHLIEIGFDVSASQELSSRAESLLKEGERARDLGTQLNRETDVIRRDLESAIRTCSVQDRPLCSVIDPSGLRLTLRIEQVNKLYQEQPPSRLTFTLPIFTHITVEVKILALALIPLFSSHVKIR